VGPLPPCVLYEDEHLLAVNKPAGLNTHAPAPHAVDGVFDWLRGHEARWASLSIVHRLDKETSGLLLFGLTPLANRSLSAQWESRSVVKRYTLRVAPAPPGRPLLELPPGAAASAVRRADGWLEVRSGISRRGERYAAGREGPEAVTLLREMGREAGWALLEAQPLTGRTHQIRAHAALLGAPVAGDELYGGPPSSRLWLHAASLSLAHPASGAPLTLEAPRGETRGALAALVAPEETSLCRLAHGAVPGVAGRAFADLLGDAVLVQGEEAGMAPAAAERLLGAQPLGARGPTVRRVLYKRLRRDIRQAAPAEDTSPRLVAGAGGDACEVTEHGVRYLLKLSEGYSVGIFGDQRENRRRVLSAYVAPGFGPLYPAGGELLNLFSYTCAFSVCAALGGARATSLDLSRRYLEWGRENFALNGIDAARHDFIYGDAADWLVRLRRKGRLFDAVLLDPPTFSSAPGGARFSAERDFGRLAALAIGVLQPGGVLFASTNAARVSPDAFIAAVRSAAAESGRAVLAQHFATQPPDFVGGEEACYLKTLWLRLS